MLDEILEPEEIIKDIYRIRVPLPNSPLRLLNSYVIVSDDRNIVIDTGYKNPVCLEALRLGLSQLNVDMSKTDILLTHLHSDHTGLAPSLAEEGTGVYLSRREIPWMWGETRTNLWAEDNVKLFRSGFSIETLLASAENAASREMSPEIEFGDYLPIDDGDVFKCAGYELRAVETPGHTPAHMCFYMEKEKIMFTGDHVLFDITPNITLWNGVDDSLGDYMESLVNADKYDVAMALPGHRERGDYHSRIAYLLEHHAQRLDECYEVVKNNPDKSALDIAGKMTWRIRCSSWEDFPIGQKWFAVGEAQSHLRRLERQGRIIADESEDVITYRVI